MSLKSIFRGDRSKFSTAVFECQINTDQPHLFTDEWIQKLFPLKYGYSVTAFGLTYTQDFVRWYMLISNGRQTTNSDISTRIERKAPVLLGPGIFGPCVRLVACVPGRGVAPPRKATSRAGTKRVRPNSPPVITVAAR